MNEEDPEPALSTGTIENGAQPLYLRSPQTARGKKGGGGARRIDSNQNGRPAHSDAWKERTPRLLLFPDVESGIGDHVGRPQGEGVLPTTANICIMITRDYGHFGRRTQRLQPTSNLLTFIGKADVGQVARDDNVVRRQSVQIVTQCVQNGRRVFVTTPESPRQVAKRTLIQEIADLDVSQRREMQIGEVGEPEDLVSLLRLPIQHTDTIAQRGRSPRWKRFDFRLNSGMVTLGALRRR